MDSDSMPATSAAKPSGTTPLREDFITNGVSFLRHPNVQQAPLSQRITFLEKKGLTQEEITEAFTRAKNGLESSLPFHSSSTPANNTSTTPPTHFSPPPPTPYAATEPLPSPPEPVGMWNQGFGYTVPGAVVAGLAIGAGITHLYRPSRRPFKPKLKLSPPWLKPQSGTGRISIPF
ncbi:peroxin pex14 [Nannochloropsis gaditana]|uniref:Peroxisomal membrane protein PEX14 n=1 Tax=Nannochloropsis gaditana TaxID=72520 RepID=W7TUV2_9STRA|nr:peroxin pex14 [Nannochloropsis gaditana]